MFSGLFPLMRVCCDSLRDFWERVQIYGSPSRTDRKGERERESDAERRMGRMGRMYVKRGRNVKKVRVDKKENGGNSGDKGMGRKLK